MWNGFFRISAIFNIFQVCLFHFYRKSLGIAKSKSFPNQNTSTHKYLWVHSSESTCRGGRTKLEQSFQQCVSSLSEANTDKDFEKQWKFQDSIHKISAFALYHLRGTGTGACADSRPCRGGGVSYSAGKPWGVLSSYWQPPAGTRLLVDVLCLLVFCSL